MIQHTLSRRALVGGSIAFTAFPVIAQQANWTSLSEAASTLDRLHAIKISKGAATVFFRVFRGPAENHALPVKSVSKALVAALTGAALDQGEIPNLNATIGELAPRLIPKGADPRVADITIAHLSTMQAGLERTSGPNYGAWVSSANWVADALARPFVATPGLQLLYSTGSFHVLGAILTEVTGRSLLSLAQNRLARALGIDIPAWTQDPQGRYLGGNKMALTLEGMIRCGEMYRTGGMCNGERVLSADWVRSSFQSQTRSPFSGLRYGYGWFVHRANEADFALARG